MLIFNFRILQGTLVTQTRRYGRLYRNRLRSQTIVQGPDLQKILGKILSLSYVCPKFILRLS